MTDAPMYHRIATRARSVLLDALGGLHPTSGVYGTLILLGPYEPGFWAHLKDSPEFADQRPDPVDRWSLRVVSDLARSLGATPLFPFGGPPHQPFIDWALESGETWVSPATFLVNKTQGMHVSFRGALGFTDKIALPPTGPRPCDTCPDQPCRTACPVGALVNGGYDAARCKSHVTSADGAECLLGGCLARRACPISATYPRRAEQSAHHMAYFL